MGIINITEEQKRNLSEELAKLVFEFKKDKDVECIYFAPYNGEKNITDNVLEITIVKQSAKNNDYNNIVQRNKLYSEGESVAKFGIKIFVFTDASCKYTFIDLNPSEVLRSNNLFNSTILFDRTGQYTTIKRQKKANGTVIFKYENLAEIIPPITDEIYKIMEEKQSDEDTKAVKEFTKSRTFQILKNMK